MNSGESSKELVCHLCNRRIPLDREGKFYLHHKAEGNYEVCYQSNERPEKYVVDGGTVDTVNLKTGRKVREENELEEYMKGNRRTLVSSQPFPIIPTYLSTEPPLTKREEVAKSNLAALIIKHGIFDETYNRKWLVEKSIEMADLLLEELVKEKENGIGIINYLRHINLLVGLTMNT